MSDLLDNEVEQILKCLEEQGITYTMSKEVLIGELLAIIDTENRYVYKGSLTYPPCT